MRTVAFHADAFADFTNWATRDPRVFERLTRLISETAKDPFSGIGKPEPLRHQLKGCWSRRITEEHRLVYQVTEASLVILSCRYHY
jgi:toxin YoeB